MHNPNRFPRKQNNPLHTQPEVVDREPEVEGVPADELNLSINPLTEELEDLASFKVFLKKNLSYQAPPAGLLASIYDRVDQIKAEE